jgi:hypothetical protein
MTLTTDEPHTFREYFWRLWECRRGLRGFPPELAFVERKSVFFENETQGCIRLSSIQFSFLHMLGVHVGDNHLRSMSSSSSVVVIVFLLSALIPLSEQRLMTKGPNKKTRAPIMTKGPNRNNRAPAPAQCFGAPPAEDSCIHFLEYDPEGVCTGLTCGAYKWYDCFEGEWYLAMRGVLAPLDPDCWFDDLHAVCDCPTIAPQGSEKSDVSTAGSGD